MSRVTRNILYNGIGQGLSLALGFAAVRFVFRRLGGDALGLIYFSQTVSAALSVALQLGICKTAVREFLTCHPEFEIDAEPTRLRITYWPDAYLIRK